MTTIYYEIQFTSGAEYCGVYETQENALNNLAQTLEAIREQQGDQDYYLCETAGAESFDLYDAAGTRYHYCVVPAPQD